MLRIVISGPQGTGKPLIARVLRALFTAMGKKSTIMIDSLCLMEGPSVDRADVVIICEDTV